MLDRMSRISIQLALATAAAVLVSAAPAGAQGRVLATVQRPTDVAAWQDDLVWSSFDPATSSYRLVLSQAGGPPAPLPVAPSARPFDVDLGTNRSGSPYAVYTRCDDGDTGCDLYRLGLRTGREERLSTLSSPAWDERDPTIFAGRIAFVRHERVGGRMGDTIRIGDTTRTGTPTRVLVRGRGLSRPELAPGDLAYTAPRPAPFGAVQVRVVHLRTGSVRLVYEARSGGANSAQVTGPSLSQTGRSFLWARTNNGSGTGNRIVRYGIASRSFAYGQGSSRWTSTSWAGGVLGMLTSASFDGTCFPGSDESPDASACQVTLTGPVRFDLNP
jgi:hypothetical protein